MRKIALVLAIAALGEGLLALHLVRQLHEERASAQALQARVSELERRAPQAAVAATLVPVPAQPAAAPFTVVQPPAPAQQQPVAPAGPESATYKEMVASFERQRALLRDPEYRAAMVAQHKTMMMRTNPDMARDLALTADQMDRLYTTMADQYVRQMEAQEFFGDVSTDPEGVSAKMQEANRKSAEQRELDLEEIRKVLGDAKYREFEQYQYMFGARSEASRIRDALATAGVPLDSNLVMPLAKAIHEYQQKSAQANTTASSADGGFVAQPEFVSPPHGRNDVEDQQEQLENMTKFQREQREALSRVLSPQQLKVIEEEQESMLQLQRAQLRVIQEQGSN